MRCTEIATFNKHQSFILWFPCSTDFVITCICICVCVCVCVYRLVAELQQLVRQPVGVSNEFLQRIFETDGFLEDLIAAIHAHRVGRLNRTQQNTQSGVHTRCCEETEMDTHSHTRAPTLETAVISHMACWGYARKTLATMVMRTVKTSSLE